jgi:hypothetical protein
MKRMLAMLAVAAITVTVFGGIAHAGGGSSSAATDCAHGGWRSLHRSDGTAFENQGDCVSYAAHGGSFEAPCLDGVGSNPDARLTGPIDTFQNGTGYSSQDGTCTGSILVPLETIVSDADAPTATAHCLTLDASVDAVQQFNVWWTAAPADWWLCLRPGGH